MNQSHHTRLIATLLCAFYIATAQPQASEPAATAYSGCKGVPADWLPECWVSVYARIQFGGDRVLYWTPYTSSRWGNALSPYWQARALALLAGQGFDAYNGFDKFWMRYLPKKLPPTTCPDLQRFKEACDLCDSDSWGYAHRCSGAWQFIRPTIINDTQHAVEEWAQAHNHTFRPFAPGDTVIQSRCSRETVLSHPEYGPVAFSFYANIKPTAKHIYIVADPGITLPLCSKIRAAKVSWLRARYPDSEVQVVGGSLERDFVRLMRAPVLFKDAQSSFGLWAALANKGEVWSVPLLSKYTNRTTPHLGDRWHWVAAPVLYPNVAEAAGITTKDTAAVIQWLEQH